MEMPVLRQIKGTYNAVRSWMRDSIHGLLELVCRSEGPLYWLTLVDDSIVSGPAYRYWASVSNNNRPFSFPNLRTANIINLYWAFKLESSSAIATICFTALSNPTSKLPAPLQSVAQQMLIQHGEIGRLQNARNILRSLPYCLQDSMGVWGALRSMYALAGSPSIAEEKPDGRVKLV